jgi:hypothetical protein
LADRHGVLFAAPFQGRITYGLNPQADPDPS